MNTETKFSGPIRIDLVGDIAKAKICIRREDGSWFKFTMRAQSPLELWNAIFSIEAEAKQALDSTQETNPSEVEIHIPQDQEMEIQVARFLAKGGTIKQIPKGKGLSSKTQDEILEDLLSGLESEPETETESETETEIDFEAETILDETFDEVA